MLSRLYKTSLKIARVGQTDSHILHCNLLLVESVRARAEKRSKGIAKAREKKQKQETKQNQKQNKNKEYNSK